MSKFTEAKLEQVFTELLVREGYPHFIGTSLIRSGEEEVLIEEDLKAFLLARYHHASLTENEADSIILRLKALSSSDLYESNKKIMKWLADGFILKREDRSQKDIHILLIDYAGLDHQRQSENLDIIVSDVVENYSADRNIYKFVTQLEIVGSEKRIPDGILYINGLPIVVFEFKTAIQETTTIHDAYKQLTVRYRRDIPELFKYNAFCVISDGVNTKAGSFFAPYEFFYAWRRVGWTVERRRELMSGEGRDGNGFVGKQELAETQDGIDSKQELAETQGEAEGIGSMFTLARGMLQRNRLRDIIQNFIYFPDWSKKEEKIVCRYPQYYAARSLYENIKKAEKPMGNGKGGTYFGATGSGKSFTMLYLTRLLMKSMHFGSPTIVLITDRTDLDDQLSEQFGKAKQFIGDHLVESVESRADLRAKMQGRNSGGVFLTTIHKFTEDTELLTERTNVICISDEAHRSQTNLDQKVRITSEGVKKSYGFAKYLHDSLPNATFVGFTGTPIDATLDVFGKVVDAYTMTESVRDEITVRIVYEGRAAKVALHNSELEKIEKYYEEAAEAGANEYQIEESKKATATMNAILGDPDRLKALAEDFIKHYENRVNEGATIKGKAMFVCSNREIGYEFYKNLISTLSSRSSSFENPNKPTPGIRSFSFEPSNTPNPNDRSSSFENLNSPNSSSSDSSSINYAQYYTKNFGFPEEWYRGKLPHRNRKNLLQFITFRLADSLPQNVLKDIEAELKNLSGEKKDIEKRKKYQYWLDKGLGCCALANREMAQVVQDAFLHHNGDRYDLLAWCIMPNHVHVLIKTNDHLSKILQSWKSFTGKWALANNKKFNLGIEKGATQFWMSENWDRFIRDENHFNTTISYILNNPAKAKLPETHTAYLFRGLQLGKSLKQQLHPTQIKMIMTRGKDDPKEMYDLLGTKEYRKELDRQFKDEKSNFKIAIVVDMWLTGFDVPFLDTIYIDKPIRQHNLIQTISRVNRKYEGKNKGLVVDYIGIKKAMNMALAHYNKGDRENFEDIQESLIVVRNHLDLLAKIFNQFDSSGYFDGKALQQLNTLNMAAEYVQMTKELETRFMALVKRLKAAYDICAGSELLTQKERDETHFYLAVRSIVFKLTKGTAPDAALMNAKVREMIKDALESDGVQEIFKLGDDAQTEQDLFSEEYMEKIDKIKLPHTKIKLLQQLLAKAIGEMKKVNKVKGIDFSKKMQTLVERYNERKEDDVLRSEVYEEMAEHLTNLIWEIQKEFNAGEELGIDFEEKAFYDILKDLCIKYDFKYPEDKLIILAQAVKDLVDSQAKYPDWSKREDIKSALKVGLIILLDEHGYPPVERDEVYKDIFEQAENFKKNRIASK